MEALDNDAKKSRMTYYVDYWCRLGELGLDDHQTGEEVDRLSDLDGD